jgi:hypothetical protein
VTTTSEKIRRAIASLASLAIAVCLYLWIPHAHEVREQLFGSATIAVPVVVAAMLWLDRLTVQLLARGAWWSMLLLATLIAIGGREDCRMGVSIAALSATALLAVGGIGLTSRGRFAPVAFRGTLLISLVLAFADTGAIGWYCAGLATFEHTRWPLLMVVPMVIGIVGLVRLRTWGLIVNALTNIAIVALVATRTLPLPSPLREVFLGSAAIQLVIPAPMFVAMIRGRQPSPDAWRRTRALAPIAIILAITALAVVGTFVAHGRMIRV